ncbi:hypothetical protein ACOME3_009137 [Neoechinorhynchus agilis]
MVVTMTTANGKSSNGTCPILDFSKERKINGNCPCGKPRMIGQVEYQCKVCRRIYHNSCTPSHDFQILPFSLSYEFQCSSCVLNPSKAFLFNLKKATTEQICMTTIANLIFKDKSKGIHHEGNYYFHRFDLISVFVEQFWTLITCSIKPPQVRVCASVARCLNQGGAFVRHPDEENFFALRIPKKRTLFEMLSELTPFHQFARCTGEPQSISEIFPVSLPIRSSKTALFPACRDPFAYCNKRDNSFEPIKGELVNTGIYRVQLRNGVAVQS